MKSYHTFSSEETKKLAAQVADTILKSADKENRRTAKVVALQGDLGSGKTTFVQGLLRALGVRGRITSPTFVLMKKFSLGGRVRKAGLRQAYHIDAYRIRAPQEADALDMENIIKDPQSLILIEWPERLGRALPHGTNEIRFSHGNSESERVVRLPWGELS